MEQRERESPSTELILTQPQQSLGTIRRSRVTDSHINWDGHTYAVLERHHHYHYQAGGYRLSKVSLYVQSAQAITETSYVDGRWAIGDASCRFNARSEILRCAVNPEGPCRSCSFYEPLGEPSG